MGMTKKRAARFTDELRAAIENCGMSRYRISKLTGIDAAVLCRFIQGQSGLSMDSLDALAECIGLHVVSNQKTRVKKGS
jgi:hypothetical protein